MKTLVKNLEGFEIYFEPLYEDIPLSDIYDPSVCDIDKMYEDLKNFNAVYFCAKVTAEKSGIELAETYLGCCYYNTYEEFYNSGGDYFDEMAEEVVEEAKEIIKSLIE